MTRPSFLARWCRYLGLVWAPARDPIAERQAIRRADARRLSQTPETKA